MAPLTPADVKRWDVDAIHAVFQTATNRAATLQALGDTLQQVHSNLGDWHGEAGDAFRADLGKTRRDIEADGQESKQVAAAVLQAEADVRAVKSELEGIEQTAEGYGFTIMSDWRIEAGMGAIGFDKLTLAAEEQLLQGQLTNCKVHAHNADQELANAVRGAVGEAPALPGTSAPGAAPPGPNAPGGTPKSLAGHAVTGRPCLSRTGRRSCERPAGSNWRRDRQAAVARRHDARAGSARRSKAAARQPAGSTEPSPTARGTAAAAEPRRCRELQGDGAPNHDQRRGAAGSDRGEAERCRRAHPAVHGRRDAEVHPAGPAAPAAASIWRRIR